MKKLSAILASLLLGVCSIFASGCLLTQAQPMKNIQGTYKLNRYDQEDKEYDENDNIQTTITSLMETRGYEFYFVVTGNNRGYYAYKSNEKSAYVREVELQYEQGSNEENAGKYAYVKYKDYTATEYETMGVTKNHLTEDEIAICWKPFGEPVISPGYNISWEKVDKATDLSYVKKQWGEVPTYTYEGWAKEGGYKAYCEYDASTLDGGEKFQDPYLYYYFVLDTWKMKATTYYAYAADKTPATKTEDITLVDGWNKIKIGEEVWIARSYAEWYDKEIQNVSNVPYTLSASRFVIQDAAEAIQEQIDNYLQQE